MAGGGAPLAGAARNIADDNPWALRLAVCHELLGALQRERRRWRPRVDGGAVSCGRAVTAALRRRASPSADGLLPHPGVQRKRGAGLTTARAVSDHRVITACATPARAADLTPHG